MSDASFLGQEFLLWIWWSAESEGGVHRLGDEARVGAAIARILEFREVGSNVRVTIRGDAPTRAPEAREALRRSMRLVRAGLVLALGDENVDVVLDAERFDLRQVVCERSGEGVPDEPEGVEEREREEVASLFGAAGAIEALFARFLEVRTAPNFARETLPAWRAWMRGEAAAEREGGPRMAEQT